jgi:hypothetical protein
MQAKAYMGMGMEGVTATWYAAIARKDMSEFTAVARRMPADVPAPIGSGSVRTRDYDQVAAPVQGDDPKRRAGSQAGDEPRNLLFVALGPIGLRRHVVDEVKAAQPQQG